MTLSKKWQIEKALLDEMKKHIEMQKDWYFDRNEILRWLDIWINAIK